jgi:Domain of unknown function (DUF1844)
MTGEENEGRAFKVQDRRRFSETGEARPDTDGGEDRQATAASASPQADEARVHKDTEQEQQAHHSPALSFAAFVISLSTQALAHLGEIPDPTEGGVRVDLDAARQMIDILVILRDKTKGNLDNAENTLLENALYDLRMKYVEKARR